MKKVYMGIDTHKDSNVLEFAFEGRGKAELIGRVSADLNRTLDAIRKFMPKRSADNFRRK